MHGCVFVLLVRNVILNSIVGASLREHSHHKILYIQPQPPEQAGVDNLHPLQDNYT